MPDSCPGAREPKSTDADGRAATVGHQLLTGGAVDAMTAGPRSRAALLMASAGLLLSACGSDFLWVQTINPPTTTTTSTSTTTRPKPKPKPTTTTTAHSATSTSTTTRARGVSPVPSPPRPPAPTATPPPA